MSDPRATVVATGLGLVSAAGADVGALLTALRAGRHCLQPIASFDATQLVMTHAGEVPAFDPTAALPLVRVRTLDRGTQLALVAARQALAQAEATGALDLQTTGVIVGLSGAQQYQNVPVPPERRNPVTRRVALYFARSTPAFQADLLARCFDLSGPRAAFASASLASLLALAHAMDLLRAGQATAMLVGGGEIQTLVNALGMDVLRLGGTGPCSPFSGSGMTFGEGAAFVLLETLERAEARGARLLGELVSAGVSADAYHEIANDPSGQGLARAIEKAFRKSDVRPADIGWIRACGSGHRVQDLAERIALEHCFAGALPPVTSTEPYFGHVNGVSPVLGVVAGLAAQQAGIAPALPANEAGRAAGSLRVLAPGPLPPGDWLLTGMAFGGGNGALLMGPVKPRRSPAKRRAAIDIAGLGVVSAIGCGSQNFLHALRTGAPAASAVQRVNDAGLPRVPGVDLRRRERLVHWSLVAAGLALTDAGMKSHDSARIGLLLGLARGPMAAYERFFEQLIRGAFDASTGRTLLKSGRFSVASEVAHAFGLQGYSGTLCCGVHGGVQLLAHGAELLRASSDLDALLVLAADEWTELCEGLYGKLRLLGGPMHAYDPSARGALGGEGAAALLLTRSSAARPVRGWARIIGTGFSGDTGVRPEPHGATYARAISGALRRADVAPSELDFALGTGCGWATHDARELAALARLRTGLPLSGVLGHTGLAESAGGLFSAIAAVGAMRAGSLAPLPAGGAPRGPADFVLGTPRTGNFRHALLCGSSERGANAALVLQGSVSSPRVANRFVTNMRARELI